MIAFSQVGAIRRFSDSHTKQSKSSSLVRLDVVANVLIESLEHALASPHDLPSCAAGRRIRAIAPASLSHLLVSIANCLRPLGVSR